MVGGELDPDTGLPAYREIAFLTPRQSGKTTLTLAWELQRCLGWDGPQTVAYSAQSGLDARQKLIGDQVPILERLQKKLAIKRILRANGSEGVEFLNGSRIGLLASSTDSGHGRSIDLAIKDEFFADIDDRRDGALIPAMATRADGQILTTSTAGTDESVPLNRLIERGRASVEAGITEGIAFFEWSAPEDADADDPEVWRQTMPALGLTIRESTVVHARSTMTDSEFRRSFLNVRTKADDRTIPLTAWTAVCSPEATPGAPLVFAIDLNPERSAAAIAAASGGPQPIAELLEHRDGTGWLVDRALSLSQRWGSPTFVVDAGGPAGSLIADLERAGITVRSFTSRDVIDAAARLYDGILEGTVRIRRHPKLDDAAAAASKRRIGDAWAFTRRSAAADISPLVAVSFAVHGAATPPVDDTPKFFARVGAPLGGW
jgi:hypothetical protein